MAVVSGENKIKMMQDLQANYMLLCRVISKMERPAYMKMNRINHSMKSFIENHKATIKPNILRADSMTITDKQIRLPFVWLKHADPLDDGKIEISYKVEGIRKPEKRRILKECASQAFKDAVPKEIFWECDSDDVEKTLALLESFSFAPGCRLICRACPLPILSRLVNVLHPKELILKEFRPFRQRGNSFFHVFHEPAYQEIQIVRIEDFCYRFDQFAQLFLGQNDDDEDEKKEIDFGGMLEHAVEYHLHVDLNLNEGFDETELREFIQNWCSGKNRMRNLNIICSNAAALPTLWSLTRDVQAVSITAQKLPRFMKKAFVEDTIGYDSKHPDLLILVLICPSKRKTGYLLKASWGILSFRSFDVYPDRV